MIPLLFCVAAGVCDAFTGLSLLVSPAFVLWLLHIRPFPLEPIYLRWVGAFVFSFGMCYLLPLLRNDTRRFITLLEMTSWVRFVIGAFVVAAVYRHALAPRWLSITAVDWTVAALQVELLRRRAFARAV